jgi:hypothetical protein
VMMKLMHRQSSHCHNLVPCLSIHSMPVRQTGARRSFENVMCGLNLCACLFVLGTMRRIRIRWCIPKFLSRKLRDYIWRLGTPE